MGDQEPGADGRPDDDAFRQLLDPAFQAGGTIREPSAAERERAARSADLRRRLAEEQAHRQQLEDRDRRQARTTHRRGRLTRLAGPLIVILLVAGIVLVMELERRGGGPSAAPAGAGSAAGAADLLGGEPHLVERRPADWPTRATPGAAHPLGAPGPAAATGGTFAFLGKQTGSSAPIAYDPCRAIHLVVRGPGPAGADAMLQEALASVTAATGLQFVDEGATDEAPTAERPVFLPQRYGDRWAPVLIAWTDPTETPELGAHGGDSTVMGQGGSAAVGYEGKGMAYVSGIVTLDRPDVERLLGGPDGHRQTVAIIEHELGHLVGLDHVQDPSQLMFPEARPGLVAFGAGDLRGLAELGRGECHPEL